MDIFLLFFCYFPDRKNVSFFNIFFIQAISFFEIVNLHFSTIRARGPHVHFRYFWSYEPYVIFDIRIQNSGSGNHRKPQHSQQKPQKTTTFKSAGFAHFLDPLPRSETNEKSRPCGRPVSKENKKMYVIGKQKEYLFVGNCMRWRPGNLNWR